MKRPSPRFLSRLAPARRWVRVTASLGLLATLSLPGIRAVPAEASSGVWILTTNTATVIDGIDPGATAAFTGPRALVLGGWPSATRAMGWASYATFASDFAAGTIPGDVRYVMYDPESWAATPLEEQRDPIRFMRAFSTLAHDAGYRVILTPHPNLTTVPGAVCLKRPEESISDAYLRCGIPGTAASLADVLDVQAQYLEADAAAYRTLVAAAAQQARAANPRVVVTAHLSTAFVASPDALFAAWRAVAHLVDGRYLGVPHGVRADVAVGFLRMVRSTEG